MPVISEQRENMAAKNLFEQKTPCSSGFLTDCSYQPTLWKAECFPWRDHCSGIAQIRGRTSEAREGEFRVADLADSSCLGNTVHSMSSFINSLWDYTKKKKKKLI